MKNREFYKEEILNYIPDGENNFCEDFVKPNILKSLNRKCESLTCNQCKLLSHIWLEEEYKETEVDWTKVEVDTPILVKDYEEGIWYKRYFAELRNGEVYAWEKGRTSWSGGEVIEKWKYAKLAEKE